MHPRASLWRIAVEITIVLSVVVALIAVLVPPVIGTRECAERDIDATQLRRHAIWLTLQRNASGDAVPRHGGYRFVMTNWTSGVVPHDAQIVDYFFTPGSREHDAHYRAARESVERGEDPWPTLDATSTRSTHYVGRAPSELATTWQDGEALMANDNEGAWSLTDGYLNVLMSDLSVHTYSYQNLQERHGLGPLQPSDPVATWGRESPIPVCRKLAN